MHVQSSDESLPAELLLLAGQSPHVSIACALLALYFPMPHRVHAAADMAVALNLPAPHAATFEPSPV